VTLAQLIARRKGDLAKKGYTFGKARVYWQGHDGNRRVFRVIIPAGGLLMFISGTCAFDESDIGGTKSVLVNPNEL